MSVLRPGVTGAVEPRGRRPPGHDGLVAILPLQSRRPGSTDTARTDGAGSTGSAPAVDVDALADVLGWLTATA